MDKISTPSTLFQPSADKCIPTPRKSTLAKIKQFARAYTYNQAAGTLGGFILN